jgi:hypothetical protein
LLPPEAEHLLLWDGAGDETWLRCDEAPFGQGRHWKSVTVSWADLRKCFPVDGAVAPNFRSKSRSIYGKEIWRAAEVKYPAGIPTSYGDTRIKRHLMPVLRAEKLIEPNANPHPKTFGRALKDYRRSTEN